MSLCAATDQRSVLLANWAKSIPMTPILPFNSADTGNVTGAESRSRRRKERKKNDKKEKIDLG